MGELLIRPVRLEDAEGYCAAFDSVARERRHLGLLKGPSFEECARTVEGAVQGRHPFAVSRDGATVAGWCNALPYDFDGFRHAAQLHMGLLAPYRARGLGEAMLRETLEMARDLHMARIELEVYASNRRAIALYERMGFAHEGVKRKLRFLDGEFEDVVCMGALL